MQQNMELTESPLTVSKDDSCSLFHRQLRIYAPETSELPHSQSCRSVRLPQVLAWKFTGIFLADVAGVHSEVSLLEISTPLQGQLVLSMCHEDGSMCIPSIRLQNTQVSEPFPHWPRGLIQSFRESVQMCPGECAERIIAGLCPGEMEEGDKEKS